MISRLLSSSLLATGLLLLESSLAITLDCPRVKADKTYYDLSELKGPKTVHFQQYLSPSIFNTTFTIDLCAQLAKDSNIDRNEQCPTGTRVCGIETAYNTVENTSSILEVIPIAGEYLHSNGRSLDPVITRLKDSPDDADPKKDGIRIELHGGKYRDEQSDRKQMAIIELICDLNKTGNEGFVKPETMSSLKARSKIQARDEKNEDGEPKEPELPRLDEGKSIQYKSYEVENDGTKVLHLTWHTKYACEGEAAKKPDNGKGSSGWGFFTWFLIIVFLLIASYIIFGSWLNYNRYGARGWDLVPHGDLIRDLPYIFKDWASSLNERIRGGSLRGGYSAV